MNALQHISMNTLQLISQGYLNFPCPAQGALPLLDFYYFLLIIDFDSLEVDFDYFLSFLIF